MKKTILLVEDTTHLAEEITDILRFEGYEVRVASGGIQGLEILGQLKPDAIITDLLMPGIDGFELIDRVRKHNTLNGIPIIVLSAKTSKDERARAIAAGANDFIVKPCKSHQLVDALKNLLEGST